jgi:hypothetical protein
LIKGLNPYAGGIVKSLLFYHIPPPEILAVCEDFQQKGPAGTADAFREEPCNSGQNPRLGCDALCLDDHVNLLNYEWEGVTWIYELKTGM